MSSYYPDTHNERVTTSVTPDDDGWLMTVKLDGELFHTDWFLDWDEAQKVAESYETASYPGD